MGNRGLPSGELLLSEFVFSITKFDRISICKRQPKFGRGVTPGCGEPVETKPATPTMPAGLAGSMATPTACNVSGADSNSRKRWARRCMIANVAGRYDSLTVMRRRQAAGFYGGLELDVAIAGIALDSG